MINGLEFVCDEYRCSALPIEAKDGGEKVESDDKLASCFRCMSWLIGVTQALQMQCRLGRFCGP